MKIQAKTDILQLIPW